MFDLSGRVALVSGAGQNVGAGIARALASQGATVVVNDLHLDRAQATVDDISAAGGSARPAVFDVTDYDAVTSAVARIEAELAPIDILVNNVGNGGAVRMSVTPFRDSDPASWRIPIEPNFFGVLNCCRAVINGMVARGFGRVITIASGAAMTGMRLGVSPYAGAKGAAVSFMRHLAVENARAGVTANTVAIGLMGNSRDRTSHLAKGIPVGRLGDPDDIGPLCVYLASDEAAWMTGQTIQLNGGGTTT